TIAILGSAQSVGQFVARHLFIIAFTVLVLFFLYYNGELLAGEMRRLLRHRIGERAEGYVDLATRALRGSVNGMVVGALAAARPRSPSGGRQSASRHRAVGSEPRQQEERKGRRKGGHHALAEHEKRTGGRAQEHRRDCGQAAKPPGVGAVSRIP